MRAVECRAGTHPQRRLVRGVEALRDGGDLEPDDVGEHRLAQRVEHDDLVEPIQELGPELGAHRVQDLALDLRELGGAVGVAGGVARRGRLARLVFAQAPLVRAGTPLRLSLEPTGCGLHKSQAKGRTARLIMNHTIHTRCTTVCSSILICYILFDYNIIKYNIM